MCVCVAWFQSMVKVPDFQQNQKTMNNDEHIGYNWTRVSDLTRSVGPYNEKAGGRWEVEKACQVGWEPRQWALPTTLHPTTSAHWDKQPLWLLSLHLDKCRVFFAFGSKRLPWLPSCLNALIQYSGIHSWESVWFCAQVIYPALKFNLDRNIFLRQWIRFKDIS